MPYPTKPCWIHRKTWSMITSARLSTATHAGSIPTQRQVHDSRKEMDRRARHAFENEHKGPSKFTGKQGRSHQPEMLRWAVPVGLQWVSRGSAEERARAMERARGLRQKHPGAVVTVESGEVCVAVVPIQGQGMEKAGQRVRAPMALQMSVSKQCRKRSSTFYECG